MMPLYVYELGPDYIVAHSAEDAWQIWCAHLGEVDEGYRDDLRQVDPMRYISIMVDADGNISDSGKAVRMQALEWAKRAGRGFLSSEEV